MQVGVRRHGDVDAIRTRPHHHGSLCGATSSTRTRAPRITPFAAEAHHQLLRWTRDSTGRRGMRVGEALAEVGSDGAG